MASLAVPQQEKILVSVDDIGEITITQEVLGEDQHIYVHANSVEVLVVALRNIETEWRERR